MFWVVQSDLYNEYGYEELLRTLNRFGIPHQIVKPVPFTSKLIHPNTDPTQYRDVEDIPEVEIDSEGPTVVCGSTSLNRIAKEKGWVPGTFLNENFDFSIWKEKYSPYLLNEDARVCRFADVDFQNETFIRPCDDSKSFPGTIISRTDFKEWQKRVCQLDSSENGLSANSLVVVASPKTIYREYRFFVVDAEVISGSLYKIGDQIHHDSNVDPLVWKFAQEMVDRWRPARAFVIDIAMVVEDGLCVVEINNINSAGFYGANVPKIVFSIDNMKDYD